MKHVENNNGKHRNIDLNGNTRVKSFMFQFDENQTCSSWKNNLSVSLKNLIAFSGEK